MNEKSKRCAGGWRYGAPGRCWGPWLLLGGGIEQALFRLMLAGELALLVALVTNWKGVRTQFTRLPLLRSPHQGKRIAGWAGVVFLALMGLSAAVQPAAPAVAQRRRRRRPRPPGQQRSPPRPRYPPPRRRRPTRRWRRRKLRPCGCSARGQRRRRQASSGSPGSWAGRRSRSGRSMQRRRSSSPKWRHSGRPNRRPPRRSARRTRPRRRRRGRRRGPAAAQARAQAAGAGGAGAGAGRGQRRGAGAGAGRGGCKGGGGGQARRPKRGMPFTSGNWTYNVQDVRRLKTLTSSGGFLKDEPKGEFVVVRVTLTNVGNTNFDLNSSGLRAPRCQRGEVQDCVVSLLRISVGEGERVRRGDRFERTARYHRGRPSRTRWCSTSRLGRRG